MQRSLWMRRVAALSAAALLATACGGGEETEPIAEEPVDEAPADDETEETPEGEGEGEDEVAVERPERDEVLDIGYILPETGPLAFLGPPQIEGVRLAIEQINEAGGVNGQDVNLIPGDEAGDAAIVRQTAADHINQGVDAVVGAAASGMSQEIIQLLADNEIAQCSASNTSPSFSDQANNEFYYRTVPPDQAVAPIIVRTVLGDGYSAPAVVARADDYGNALKDLVVAGFEEQGVEVVVNESYDPNTSDFSSLVSSINSAGADSVVVIGFGEAATLFRQLIEGGFDGSQLYGGDGVFGPTLATQVNESEPGFIEGLKVIGAAGGQEFNDQLNAQLDEENQGNLIYGGQSYDCAIITALAAISAGSVDPVDFIAEVPNVTKEGTECTEFAECKELLEAGEDIDYNGASGPLAIEGTDPTVGRYAIGQFQADGSLDIVGSEDIDLAEIE
jgi:ABC-type branched-subunit amino acid transport system substrate-binding protein